MGFIRRLGKLISPVIVFRRVRLPGRVILCRFVDSLVSDRCFWLREIGVSDFCDIGVQ